MSRFNPAAALVLVVAVGAATVHAQLAYNSVTNQYYAAIPFRVPPETARRIATEMGGTLASIHNNAERTFILSHFGSLFQNGEGIWIGASDQANEGTFVFDDGTPFNYAPWGPSEPNNSGNEDYVEMGLAGQWNDLPSWALRRAIVKGDVLAPLTAGGLAMGQDFNAPQGLGGWAFGPEWTPGIAIASPPTSFGYGDPGSDSHGVVAGGIAGVVRGGIASTSPAHGWSFMTSPQFPVPSGMHAVLTFQRWLNSDYAPYMVNHVDVFDGTAWQTVWDSTSLGSTAITDGSWNFQSIDVGQYANPGFGVRFGFMTSAGVYAYTSWNVDDVAVFYYAVTPTLGMYQPNGAGSIGVRNIALPHNGTALTVFHLAPYDPGGWFFGLDIPLADVIWQYSLGVPPFVSPLDSHGMSDFRIPSGVPPGLTIWGVTVILLPNGTLSSGTGVTGFITT